MYRRTAKASHFIPRTASYSTHPHRNGRVDVLPPSAVEMVWDVADQLAMLEDRLATLHEQKLEVDQVLHRAGRLAQMQSKLSSTPVAPADTYELKQEQERLERQIFTTRYNMNELRSALNPRGRQISRDAAFVILARLELDHDVFQTIERKAERLIAKMGKRCK